MRLSLAFGTPRRRLMRWIDAEEFREWQAFDQFIEPIGDRRADRRAAYLAQAVFATHGVPVKLETIAQAMALPEQTEAEAAAQAAEPVRKPASPELLARNAIAEERIRKSLEAQNRGHDRPARSENGAGK